VMEPVRRLVGASKRLLVSPDGALNLVPFAALVDERGKYLVESYEIQYLTSGRDLLRLVARRGGALPVIVADPDFGTGPGGAERGLELAGAASSAPAASDLSRVFFTPLPGTAEEARALSRLMAARVLVQGEATEAALKQVVAPGILHIATHGYFLERAVTGPASNERERDIVYEGDFKHGSAEARGDLVEDPLLRSGLGLAGANLRRSGTGEDGLLTALEATGLNLWGTSLVVLSACDTGIGQVKTGDGVYGLRRALVLAGAETTMMSLWPVSDAGTRDLMVEFYAKLRAGIGRSEALRRTQLEMLGDPARRHPYYWASFIQSGAWGPLASPLAR
jgi:CHAT domain-containing protein